MIRWELLLKDEDVCEALSRLYTEMGIHALSTHLGVSRVALIKKLKACNVVTRPRGGPHTKVPEGQLPDYWWQMETTQLADLTGYCLNYCRKLKRRKVCELAGTIKINSQDSPSDTKVLSSESTSTETSPESGENESSK